MNHLAKTDKKVAEALKAEIRRQREGIELIPSENFASLAVLEALGSVFTNKYSEGYPGNRYYGGTEHVDTVEQLAIDRAKALFGAEHANVQPLSGAPANIAVYSALLEPGDTVLGMDLSHGGHLTHGHPITWMAKIFKFVRYKTTPDGMIDFDQVRLLAREHKPKIILAGYSAYSRDLDYEQFKAIADEVGAYTMADIAHIAGLIAAGEMNNPTSLFDVITTTTHKTLRGPRGGLILCKKKLAKKIDKAVFPGFQGGPHENNIAAKAIAFHEAGQAEFKEYARQVKKNAKVLCNTLEQGGLKIMFGGTENHLILADVTPLGLSGKQAQELLDNVNITLNKNMIPDDPRKPMDPSGIRLGTPAVTTRGFIEIDMKNIGQAIISLIKNPNDEKIKTEARTLVAELANKYPLYSEIDI
ncbi:serine hydroxymethyltransferase [Patescibacteria group bacterium]|nr:serine hydroxymethyltransferase [Patescibacteria group bacterium]MBU1890585.1 serine hydroxymethyltransferase [Patescibacteria group bacterium]